MHDKKAKEINFIKRWKSRRGKREMRQKQPESRKKNEKEKQTETTKDHTKIQGYTPSTRTG